jgi:hypothetical protein
VGRFEPVVLKFRAERRNRGKREKEGAWLWKEAGRVGWETHRDEAGAALVAVVVLNAPAFQHILNVLHEGAVQVGEDDAGAVRGERGGRGEGEEGRGAGAEMRSRGGGVGLPAGSR